MFLSWYFYTTKLAQDSTLHSGCFFGFPEDRDTLRQVGELGGSWSLHPLFQSPFCV